MNVFCLWDGCESLGNRGQTVVSMVSRMIPLPRYPHPNQWNSEYVRLDGIWSEDC